TEEVLQVSLTIKN
ncbi:hypothetical protein SuUB63_21331, partial [Streptococcus uberis]